MQKICFFIVVGFSVLNCYMQSAKASAFAGGGRVVTPSVQAPPASQNSPEKNAGDKPEFESLTTLRSTTEDQTLPDHIALYTTEKTRSGGTQSTFIVQKDEEKYILKIIQNKEELLADILYQTIAKKVSAFNLHVPAFKILPEKTSDGKFQRLSRFLNSGDKHNIAEQAKQCFVVDAFMANWDVTNNNNLLEAADGHVYHIDNGGALRYRALGEPKSGIPGYDFTSAISDLSTLRGLPYQTLQTNVNGARLYAGLSENDILKQIEQLIEAENDIIHTADVYQELLKIDDYESLRSQLIQRLDSLKEYYYNHPQILSGYQTAHPFRLSIPNLSSASILIYSIDSHDGKVKILLGKRCGHHWWGNFGGRSDPDDVLLMETAMREVQEESMGVYSFLSDDLVKAPFHDLIKDRQSYDALHRMYAVYGDYHAADALQRKLATQTEAASREYTEFKWVAVEDLLRCVEASQSRENIAGNEQQYSVGGGVFIFHPFMDMLRQKPVMDWLQKLVEVENANSPDKKSLKKSLRWVGTQGSIGSSSNEGRYQAPAFEDPRAEVRERLYRMLSSHMNTLTEIKKRERVENPVEVSASAAASEVTEGLPERTATDAHLQLALGHAYREWDDQENVRQFLMNNNSGNYYNQIIPLFGGQPPLENKQSFKTAILNAMAKERENKDWFVFYHTLPNELSFFYDVVSLFRNFFRLQGADQKHSLRMFDHVFQGLENVEQFVQDEMHKQRLANFQNLDNYKGTFQHKGLSANMMLFGSQGDPLSESFIMFFNNRSGQRPDLDALYNQFFGQLSLMSQEKYKHLYQTYFKNHERSNALLQIFIHPSDVDDLVYISRSGGHGLYSTWNEQKKNMSPGKFIDDFRKNPKKALGQFNIKDLQARIFMKPSIMTDPKKVTILTYHKQPLDDRYHQALKDRVRLDMIEWLLNRIHLDPGVLENVVHPHEGDFALPPIQKSTRHYFKEEKQRPYTLSSSEKNYGIFLVQDNCQGFKRILAQNPNFDFLKEILNVDQRDHFKKTILPIELLIKAPTIRRYIMNDSALKERVVNFMISTLVQKYHYEIIEFLKKRMKDDECFEETFTIINALKGHQNYDQILSLEQLYVHLIETNQNVYQDALAFIKETLKREDVRSQYSALELLFILTKETQNNSLEIINLAMSYIEKGVASEMNSMIMCIMCYSIPKIKGPVDQENMQKIINTFFDLCVFYPYIDKSSICYLIKNNQITDQENWDLLLTRLESMSVSSTTDPKLVALIYSALLEKEGLDQELYSRIQNSAVSFYKKAAPTVSSYMLNYASHFANLKETLESKGLISSHTNAGGGSASAAAALDIN